MIQEYVKEQALLHPAMQAQDALKLCYQAAFGAEHLLLDEETARLHFMKEFDMVPSREGLLWEAISPEVCRVNLGAWKACGLPAQWLFRLFVLTSPLPNQGAFSRYLEQTGDLALSGRLPFSAAAWQALLSSYPLQSPVAVHHSVAYRQQEQPSYRLVSSQLMRMLPILKAISALPPVERAYVMALDGRAASGKSTLAVQLSQVIQAGVVHMDDFFLPPLLRTPERLAQPGGNIHYERFQAQVLPHLKEQLPFVYQRFDCGSMALGPWRTVPPTKWHIVEGCYCCHPLFGNYMDLRFFCDVSPQEQRKRIVARDGARADAFFQRWIPMEEAYFSAFHIPEQADFLL